MIRTLRSRERGTIALALVLSAAPALPALAQAKPATAKSAGTAINVPYEKYLLPNGLTVILSQDRSTPTVAVQMVYHVGSKNEQVGRTGFAHLFEHVMFTGSGHIPYGFHDKYTEGVGGSNNGSTNNDVTEYHETVPSNYLRTALWLESDRMGWLLDSLDEKKFIAQREIVKNERRQRVDNAPYGRAYEIIGKAMYPANHSYSWPVIGSMADLSAASVEDVKQFFRLYYAPNNAVLAIAGDFDVAQTKEWISTYFGEIPRSKAIVRPTSGPVTLSDEKRMVYEDVLVQIPRLYVSWPTVGARADDQYALELLGSVLSGSRTARLDKALVYEKQSAASLFAGQNTSENVGEFMLSITPRPGHSLTDLELAADSIIARVKREGPTAQELERAKAGLQFSFVSGIESNLGKVNGLAIAQAFHGDPGYDFKVQYAKYQAVTAADIKRAANKYLGSGRVVLSIVPKGKKDQASKPDASITVTENATAVRSATTEGR